MLKTVFCSDKLVIRLDKGPHKCDLGYMCGVPDLSVGSTCGSLAMGHV